MWYRSNGVSENPLKNGDCAARQTVAHGFRGRVSQVRILPGPLLTIPERAGFGGFSRPATDNFVPVSPPTPSGRCPILVIQGVHPYNSAPQSAGDREPEVMASSVPGRGDRPDNTSRDAHRVTERREQGGEDRVRPVAEDDSDATERVRIEGELHALRREYEELIGSVEAIIWKGEARTLRFTFVSHQAEAILGYPAERWLEEPSFWEDHIHPEDREWAISFCKAATADKRSHSFDYRMIAADDRVVWLRDIVHVSVEGGVPTQLFGVMVDITERKEAEEALRRSEQRYRTMIEEQTELVCRFLPDKTLTFVNDAYCRYFGEKPEELIE